MYSKKQKTVAMIACMAFLLVTLCSILFIVKEANHDCTGENCPICAQISEVENTLKKLGNGDPAVSTVTVSTVIWLFIALVGSIYAVPYTTPVTQKVRMNN